MKKFYFSVVFIFALIISSSFAFAQVKPKNLNCKLAQNADNEWCEMERGYSYEEEEEYVEEADIATCEVFIKVPVYKAKGDDVKTLQTILLENTPKLKVDGVFGPKTKAALIEYQKANDLTPSGKVDDETLEFIQDTSNCAL